MILGSHGTKDRLQLLKLELLVIRVGMVKTPGFRRLKLVIRRVM